MKRIKSTVNRRLSPLDLRLIRVKKLQEKKVLTKRSMPSCKERLIHAKSIGFEPSTIVDAGAYVGDWTVMAASVFPDALFTAIEPNPSVHERVNSSLNRLSNDTILIKNALADRPGILPFNIWGDPATATSASLQTHVRGNAEQIINVEVNTIDNIMNDLGMSPDLLKLDLQGAELRALKGAEKAMKSAEMVIVEFGCLEAYHDRATPRQLMDLLYDNDFCLYDIVDCHYRPYDGALTGGDFFFIKNNSQLRKYKGWD